MAIKTQTIESLADKFKQYTDWLSDVPNHVPLMAPEKKPVQLYQKQIREAFLYQKWILDAQTIADIGTGSGFPGITLALLNPDKLFRLVSSLQISNIEQYCLRAEDLSSQSWQVSSLILERPHTATTWLGHIGKRQGLPRRNQTSQFPFVPIRGHRPSTIRVVSDIPSALPFLV